MAETKATEDGSTSTIKTLSLSSLLAKEERLLKQASRAMPHAFNTCTYDAPGGYIRQAIYLCKTCKGPDGRMGKGICSACSISCHADHEQLELFPKRGFRCDCPTTAIPINCTLHVGRKAEPPNDENVYGQNFQGRFCRCGRDYDPKTEPEIMAQCLACEDWYHESCLNLFGRTDARALKSSPTKGRVPTSSPPPRSSEPPSSEYEYDDDEEDEEDGTKLIPASGYECIICGPCVAKIPGLRRWAGTKGVQMIINRNSKSPTLDSSPMKASGSGAVDFGGWEVLGEDFTVMEDPTATAGATATTSDASSQKKRSASSATQLTEEPPTKKFRLENGAPSTKSSCRAPPMNELAQRVFTQLDWREKGDDDALEVTEPDAVEGEGDIFLSEGWRERWCRCDQCLPVLQAFPYLLEEEETYVPPEDPDSKKSLEELGLRALQTLPRDKALDSIRAFNEMRDDLLAYLRPFAQEGKVVSETDVTAFFDALKAGERPPAPTSTT
ncbi:hypothetical protein FRB95_008920 [Tulasnella sp. JGI-2019a]|nr:hypothetical protein FRB95_008920 [Tulasnella sp. JGI-2019a]